MVRPRLTPLLLTRRRLFGSLLPLLLLSATGTTSRCHLSTESGTGELRIRGTVHFIENGGGCWQLDAGEGRRYELLPGQAPASLLRDGVTATVTGQPAEASVTGCRVGLPFAVRHVVWLRAPGGA
jgi:hypothetical protein